MAQFRVDFGIEPSISDQIDDPAFGFIRFHVQFVGQHANGDALMDATECFEDHQTGILDEFVQPHRHKEIVIQNGLAFVQLQTGTFEIEIDQQMFQEFGDWIAVCVRFLLDDFDQVFEGVTASLVDDHGNGQVTQNVRAHRLDGIQIQWLVQEHFDHKITTLWVVNENEHTPVNQPGALLQCFNVAVN